MAWPFSRGARARWVMVAACALSVGCAAPGIAPPGGASDTPVLTDAALHTRDGLDLPLRHWDAVQPRAVIVALHGMSDYSNTFAFPAPYWAERGITTIAYDQRGFGASPHAGIWGGSDAMRADLLDAIAATRAKYPGVPLFALGQSMGGAVVLSALASPTPPKVDGVILIAPAVWSRGDMPALYRVALWTVAHTLPGIHLSGSGLKIWATDNVEVLRQNGLDPLFQKNANAGAVYGLVNLMDEARRAPAHLSASTPPILFLYGSNDQVIPGKPTEAVAKELGARAEVHRYVGGYHMLLHDLHAEPRWKDVADWILKGR